MSEEAPDQQTLIAERLEDAKKGRCICDCVDVCPLGRAGSEYRCTVEELREALLKT